MKSRLRTLWRFSKVVATDLMHDNAAQWSAAIAFYSLISVFPLLLAMASVASFFVDQEWAVQQVMAWLAQFVPEGEDLVEQTIREVLASRGTAGFIALLVLLWAGSRVFGVLIRALNIIYDAPVPYSFLRRTLFELAMTISLGLLGILALSSSFAFEVAEGSIPIFGANAFLAVSYVIPLVLAWLTFFLLYKTVPKGDQDWRAAVLGAAAATAMITVARYVFSAYVQTFGQYNLVYGSIAIIVVLLFWAWLVSFFTLIGGSIAAHYQEIVLRGSTLDEVEERHRRRSPNRSEEANEAA